MNGRMLEKLYYMYRLNFTSLCKGRDYITRREDPVELSKLVLKINFSYVFSGLKGRDRNAF